MITSIAFTVYPVSKMERSRAFYELVGFKVVVEGSHVGDLPLGVEHEKVRG